MQIVLFIQMLLLKVVFIRTKTHNLTIFINLISQLFKVHSPPYFSPFDHTISFWQLCQQTTHHCANSGDAISKAAASKNFIIANSVQRARKCESNFSWSSFTFTVYCATFCLYARPTLSLSRYLTNLLFGFTVKWPGGSWLSRNVYFQRVILLNQALGSDEEVLPWKKWIIASITLEHQLSSTRLACR